MEEINRINQPETGTAVEFCQNMIQPIKDDDCLIFPGRIPTASIVIVNSVLDDLEGLAVLRTEDPVEGRLEFWVTQGMVDEFFAFVEFIKKEYGIPVEISDPIPYTTEFESKEHYYRYKTKK